MNRWKIRFITCWVIGWMITSMIIAGCQEGSRFNWKIWESLTGEQKMAAMEREKEIEVIYETNWMAMGFILAIAVGIFTTIRGKPGWGIPIIMASCAGWLFIRIDQRLMMNKWMLSIPAGLIVIGFLVFLYRDVLGKKAFKARLNGDSLTKPMRKLIGKYQGKVLLEKVMAEAKKNPDNIHSAINNVAAEMKEPPGNVESGINTEIEE